MAVTKQRSDGVTKGLRPSCRKSARMPFVSSHDGPWEPQECTRLVVCHRSAHSSPHRCIVRTSSCSCVFVPSRKAFTLVELILVIAILAILAGIAVPRYGQSIARQRVESTARRICTDIAYAQRRARYLSKGVTLKFNTSSHQYTLLNTPDPDRPHQAYSVCIKDGPYEAAFSSVDFGGDTDLVFNGYGMPDSGGSVVVQVGTFTKTVTVNAETGLASIP